MENALDLLFNTLNRLIGLHRQFLDLVRLELEALTSADIKKIQEMTYQKEALIHSIQQAESERKRATGQLAPELKLPIENITLSKIIIEVQGKDLKKADSLRSTLNTLVLLIGRIREQNLANAKLLEKSIFHVGNMKRNVASTVSAGSLTYTAQGQKSKAFREKGIISEKG